jgi:hypothetical protein
MGALGSKRCAPCWQPGRDEARHFFPMFGSRGLPALCTRHTSEHSSKRPVGSGRAREALKGLLARYMPLVSAAGAAALPVISATGAAALSARHARDATSLDTAFQHLTAARLAALEAELDVPSSEVAPLLATAVLRRIAHRVLDKRASFGDVGAALAQHGWSGAVEAMKASAAGSNEALWSQVMID